MYHGETEKSSNNLYYTQLSHGPFPVLLLHAFALPKQLLDFMLFCILMFANFLLPTIFKEQFHLGELGCSLLGLLFFNTAVFVLFAAFRVKCQDDVSALNFLSPKDEPTLCRETLEACQVSEECDRYRLDVNRLGRCLTVGEARMLIENGSGGRERKELCTKLSSLEPAAQPSN